MKDKIVEEVIQKFESRSKLGIQKYGTTLEQNNTDDFLTHALEEAMDFTLYIQKIKTVLKDNGFNKLEDLIVKLKDLKNDNN